MSDPKPRNKKPPGKYPGPKHPLSPEQWKRLVAAAGGKGVQGKRNRALLHLHFSTCLRASDLLDIRFNDLLTGNPNHPVKSNLVVVQEKTKNRVTVEISPKAAEAVLEWAAAAYEIYNLDDPSVPLFFSLKLAAKGIIKALSYSGYFHNLQRWVKRAGLDHKKISTHSIRKTLPMAHYEQTRDFVGVSQLLGHRRLSSTMYYLVHEPTDISSVSQLFEE